MDKKRILLVTDVYGWGGHVRAEYIKKHLSDEFEFDIVDGEDFKEKNKEDYDLVYLLFHTMLLRKDVTELLFKCDVKVMSIVTGSSVIRSGFINGRGYRAGLNHFLIRANKCVSIGANNLASLNDLKSIYRKNIFYAPRGVDPNVFYPTKEFQEKSEDQFTACYVGKPVKEKGLEDIIEPACKKAGIKLISNTKNYTDAFTPTEMNNFYNKADVYIVASTIDGTPNPALEAAACGLPLVSNHIGNMPELIKDHKNGWLVERKIEEYVHRLNWIKRNQRKAWEIGQKGREEILKNWIWEQVLNKNERMEFRRILS